MPKRKIVARCVGATVLLLALAQSAQAQQSSNSSELQEIVVTARRVNERVQRVPVTVNAFNAATLRESSLVTPQDLTVNTPAIFLSGSGSAVNSEYGIRGQSKPVAGGSPTLASVVTYLNDVPLTTYLSSLPQFDMSSVQVLKGPQGTLFGRNTTGGAILLYSQVPTYDFSGYVQATLGTYNTHNAEGAINIPIIDDKLAVRLAGIVDRHDGYFSNLGAGGDLQNAHDQGFRVSVLAEPTDWIKNTVVYSRQFSPLGSTTSGAQVLVGVSPAFASLIPQIPRNLAIQNQRGPYILDTGSDFSHQGWKAQDLSNKTVVDINDQIFVQNIFGFRDFNYYVEGNFDGQPQHFFDAQQVEGLRQISDEIQVHGTFFGNRLKAIGGLFYFNSAPNGPFGGFGSEQDLLAGVTGFPPAALIGGETMGYDFYSDMSRAIFGNLQYDLSDFVKGLKFNVGYRYTWDRFAACSGNVGNLPTTPDGYVDISPGFYQLKPEQCDPAHLIGYSQLYGSSSAPTWQVGFDYEANDELFFYATARHGYRAGGLNTPGLGPAFVSAGFQTYRPEKVMDEEIGMKADWKIYDVPTRFDVSAFHTLEYNQQLVGTQLSSNGVCPWLDGDCDPSNDPTQTTLVINGGETELFGFEGELTVRPFHDLSVTVAGSYLRGLVRNTGVPAFVAANFPVGALLFTPVSTELTRFRYTVPGIPEQWGAVVANADFYWSSPVEFQGYTAKSYDLLNLRIDWNDIGGKGIDVAFYIKNVFDKQYVTGPAFTGSGTPFNTVLFGDPRTIGTQIRYRF